MWSLLRIYFLEVESIWEKKNSLSWKRIYIEGGERRCENWLVVHQQIKVHEYKENAGNAVITSLSLWKTIVWRYLNISNVCTFQKNFYLIQFGNYHITWIGKISQALLQEICNSIANIFLTLSHWYVDKINSLWPSDAIWWHKSGSTLAQVVACCLTAPSHYLNQCWLISQVQWRSSHGNFTSYTSVIKHWV